MKTCAFTVTFSRKFERSCSSLIFLHFVMKPLRMSNSYSRSVASKLQLLLFLYWNNCDTFSCSLVLHYIILQKSRGCISRIKIPWKMFLDNYPENKLIVDRSSLKMVKVISFSPRPEIQWGTWLSWPSETTNTQEHLMDFTLSSKGILCHYNLPDFPNQCWGLECP